MPDSWNVLLTLGRASGPLPTLASSSSVLPSATSDCWLECDAEGFESEASREGGGPEDEAEAEPELASAAVEPKSDPSGSCACASAVGHFTALVVGSLGCLPFRSE